MHGCYMLAFHTKAKEILEPLQLFTLVFSGLCHDVNHTAKNNAFEIST